MTFYDVLSKANLDNFRQMVISAQDKDVERALSKDHNLDLNDFAALISENARKHYLKIMAHKAQEITRRRFGNTVNMYIPLYLTNLCSNNCSYCGFSVQNKFRRTVLTLDQIREECKAINKLGYKNILLVSGENGHRAGMEYFKEVLPVVREYAAYLQMEVQPLDMEEYSTLKSLGLDSVSVYQETYHQKTYEENHISGKKSNMRYRLETTDRLGQAGIDKVGIGALLGLYDYRVDTMALALHLLYLREKYWQMRVSVSFPRLRPAEGGFEVKYPVDDAHLIQLILAFRLFDNEVDLTLSTRESAYFRDNIVPLAITAVSAGSSTEPGGYATNKGEKLEQWEINDSRSVDEVVAALRISNLEPVFHDASTTYFKIAKV